MIARPDPDVLCDVCADVLLSADHSHRITRCGICFVILALAVLQCSCGGSQNPAQTMTTHVPINTGTGWTDSPFISSDGQRLYFMYSRYNFAPWILSGGTVMPLATGPDRPGLHHSSQPFDESDIYVAIKNPDGTWSEATNLGLNGAYGDSSGMEINGGDTFLWLQGNGSTNNIVMADKNPDGTWRSPVDLGTAINDHTANVIQDNPHISPDGSALWFTSSRAGGAGGKDIWFSGNTNGVWSQPVNSGTPVNTTGDDDQIWISPVGPDVYWNGPQGLMHCLSNGSNCAAAPEIVTIPGCDIAAEASLPDDGSSMYFGCFDLATGVIRIMYSMKQPNGSWGAATPVD
ncbi:MAG: hypothetical protein ABI479_04345 [Gallionella sp.]